jgi:hypothetical protein
LAEDLSIALLLILDRLSPLERAAFLLHDVFDFSFSEIATALERNAAACRQLAVRARANVRAARPRGTNPPPTRSDGIDAQTCAAHVRIRGGNPSRRSQCADTVPFRRRLSRRARRLRDPNLRSISHAHILAVGDSAHPIAPTGAPYRKSALAAGASGAHAARVIMEQRAKRELQPFSFSTLAQAVAIGRLGVIYLLDRNDRQIGYIVKGRTARKVRDFFLLLVIYGFKFERRFPGSFYLAGGGRVSWREANDAIQKFKTAQKV